MTKLEFFQVADASARINVALLAIQAVSIDDEDVAQRKLVHEARMALTNLQRFLRHKIDSAFEEKTVE